MKRKAEPASVEEEVEDPRTGSICLKAGVTAAIISSPDQYEQRRKWRKSDLNFESGSASKYLGTMVDVISQFKEDEIYTIIAGAHEDTLEVWKECERLGRKYRAFYLADKVLNGESRTYVERQIPVSKEVDLQRVDPNIIIAQRTYSARGSIELKAHLLYFNGRLDLDRPYIFPKLGDEIPGVGYPDLHCTFRSIRDWDTVVKIASFASWDRNVSIEITAADVESKKRIVFDIERDEVVSPGTKPTLGVEICCSDFKPLLKSSTEAGKRINDTYPSPPSGKQRMHDATTEPKKIGMKLIGMGPAVEGTLRADLNITLVLKE